eukprot:1261454-Amphidinium_carterae.1
MIGSRLAWVPDFGTTYGASVCHPKIAESVSACRNGSQGSRLPIHQTHAVPACRRINPRQIKAEIPKRFQMSQKQQIQGPNFQGKRTASLTHPAWLDGPHHGN